MTWDSLIPGNGKTCLGMDSLLLGLGAIIILGAFFDFLAKIPMTRKAPELWDKGISCTAWPQCIRQMTDIAIGMATYG